MTVMMVPAIEEEPWPSLGGLLCQWIEANLVFGPGDLRGQPARLDEEKRFLIYRLYEVWPDDSATPGRRRFRRAALSMAKGTAKTEMAAWIAACELHPEAPVRCYGFDGLGNPMGRGVTDPYIPLVAYTEEQTEDLAYHALRVILQESRLHHDFDIGLERILRKAGDGKAVPLASAPDARDGARTTFQHFDETHRFTLPRLKQAHRTMLANLPKRLLADPWALETTTAYTPGESSVAEDTRTYARQVVEGAKADSRLFFFHRQASDLHDIETPEGLRAAVEEAAGPTAPWRDIDGICEQWQDPTADRPYLERVWLNRSVQASRQAFDVNRWRELAHPDAVIPEGELVTLGFDGARFHDATALVVTAVESGLQSLIGFWEPKGTGEWETPEQEVDAAVAEAFDRWSIWRLYADPYWFEGWLAAWSGRYGADKVISWRTNRLQQMAYALKAFDTAIHSAEVSHDGNEALTRHIGAACRRETQFRDDAGARLWVIEKERPDSPFKIDAAMAAVLSWRARLDALSAGAAKPAPQWSGIFIPGGSI